MKVSETPAMPTREVLVKHFRDRMEPPFATPETLALLPRSPVNDLSREDGEHIAAVRVGYEVKAAAPAPVLTEDQEREQLAHLKAKYETASNAMRRSIDRIVTGKFESLQGQVRVALCNAMSDAVECEYPNCGCSSTFRDRLDRLVPCVVSIIDRLTKQGPAQGLTEEAIAQVLCRSGKFETGHGTCSLFCMDQLGDPRKRGCSHSAEVFKQITSKILAAPQPEEKV